MSRREARAPHLLGLDRLFDSLRSLKRGPLQFPVRTEPVAWIEEHGYLPASASTRSGSVRLYPWQREIFAAMCGYLKDASGRTIREIAVPKCTQVGLTTLGILASTFLVSMEQARVTFAMPNKESAQLFAEDEVDPIFEAMDAMRDITRPRVKGETQDKWFFRQYVTGGRVRFVGAAANNAFRSYKSRVMICDEIDDENWRDTSDSGEGDKLILADQRMETFWNSIKIMFSTPKLLASSLIWKQWLLSDKRRWFIKCPHCEFEQWLKFGSRTTEYGLKWSRDAKGRVDRAWYVCQSKACHQPIPEDLKVGLLNAGRWIATDDPTRPGLAGFHVNRLISTSAKATWTNIAQLYVEAEGDPTKLQPFYNLVLGEPWDEWQVGGADREGLAARAEPYAAEIPDGVKRLALTVDTNRGTDDGRKNAGLECAVVGVGEGRELWTVGYEVLDRHPAWSAKSREELDALRRREWKRADGTTMRIDITVLDRGEMPTEVMDYARTRVSENVFAIKGANTDKGTRLKEMVPGKPSRNPRTRHQWYMVCTQSAKDLLDKLLRNETPGPGYVHFHSGLPASWYEGLKQERLIQQSDGSLFWKHVDKKKPNEPWDLMTYAVIAIEMMAKGSEQFLRELEVTVRGPDAPPRLRHDGPNRGWVPKGQKLDMLAKAFKATVDAARNPGRKGQAEASPDPEPEAVTASEQVSPKEDTHAPAPAAPSGVSSPWTRQQQAEPAFQVRSSFMDRMRR